MIRKVLTAILLCAIGGWFSYHIYSDRIALRCIDEAYLLNKGSDARIELSPGRTMEQERAMIQAARRQALDELKSRHPLARACKPGESMR